MNDTPDNIIKFDKEFVTVEDVIDDLVEEQAAGELIDIYVVGFNSKGERQVWASGNLQRMAVAAITLNATATKYIMQGLE